jgi:hypothetical protein
VERVAGGELLNLLSAQKSKYAALVRRTDGAKGKVGGQVSLSGGPPPRRTGVGCTCQRPDERREAAGTLLTVVSRRNAS